MAKSQELIKDAQLLVLLTRDQHSWLKGEAQRRDVSMGTIVREQIEIVRSARDIPKQRHTRTPRVSS